MNWLEKLIFTGPYAGVNGILLAVDGVMVAWSILWVTRSVVTYG